MKWQKKGRLFSPPGRNSWSVKYGMMPTPFVLPGQDVIRIYFGVTTEDKFGRIIFMDVDKNDPSRVLAIHDESPTLDLGKPGTFDDSGVIPSSYVEVDGRSLLYYVGFQRCVKVPYMLFPGLATKNTNGSFERYRETPIIDRNLHSVYSHAAPFVMYDEGKFRMWLWIAKEWTTVNEKLYMKASIGYAESGNGLSWTILKENCISAVAPNEFSVGRPWVIKEDGTFKMFYSVRYIDRLYRLGYAESKDALNWERKDHEAGIDVSDSGWDSEMICYPAVITAGKRTYLFYNGNNNGETGFGWAERID